MHEILQIKNAYVLHMRNKGCLPQIKKKLIILDQISNELIWNISIVQWILTNLYHLQTTEPTGM